jgi:mRNA interferase HigB
MERAIDHYNSRFSKAEAIARANAPLLPTTKPKIIPTGYKDASQWCAHRCDLALKYLPCHNSADNMHLIAISRLREAADKFLDIDIQIEDWNEIVKVASWQNLTEVQQTYSSTEAVGNFTVFNIKGNRYRLIVSINYSRQLVYFKYFLTHAEYDKDNWKNDPYF